MKILRDGGYYCEATELKRGWHNLGPGMSDGRELRILIQVDQDVVGGISHKVNWQIELDAEVRNFYIVRNSSPTDMTTMIALC